MSRPFQTLNRDLSDLERHMRESQGMKRGPFCDELGISQGRLRRQLELGEDAEVPRTLALAMAAVASGLAPFVPGRLRREGGGGAPSIDRDGDQESEGAPRG